MKVFQASCSRLHRRIELFSGGQRRKREPRLMTSGCPERDDWVETWTELLWDKIWWVCERVLVVHKAAWDAKNPWFMGHLIESGRGESVKPFTVPIPQLIIRSRNWIYGQTKRMAIILTVNKHQFKQIHNISPSSTASFWAPNRGINAWVTEIFAKELYSTLSFFNSQSGFM